MGKSQIETRSAGRPRKGVLAVLLAVVALTAGTSGPLVRVALANLPPPVFYTAVSTQQYTLSGSSGTAWTTIDGTNLVKTVTPASDSIAILGGNVDLFTNTTGFNQDIGIFVSVDSGADQLLAWKESGGYAGIYSPNAAFVQSVYSMTGTHSYAFKLKWKTNKAETAGVIVYAAAGSGSPYSPTRLTAEVLPTAVPPHTVVSTQQYTLAGSNGSDWSTIDGTNLVTSISPASDEKVILGGNVDLFTNTRGFNQDIGIFVSVDAGADQLVAWKESGGFAGVFSPNAAFVQSVYTMTGTHAYTFKLEWKTNKPETAGVVIYGGAGSGVPFSPTRLVAEEPPSGSTSYSVASTQQYTLAGNDGNAWSTIDAANLVKAITPSVNTTAILGGNVDLFTNTTGFNQDVGIFVKVDSGADQLLAWKESGGYAGVFSPNAAFVQTVYGMLATHTYTFKLKWKTNKPETAGVTIYAAAGGGSPFSPTRLTAETAPTPLPPPLVVNEFQTKGAGGAHDAFVELYNPVGAAQAIDGWSLVSRTATGTTDTILATLPPGSTIAATGYFVFTGSAYTGTVAGGVPTLAIAAAFPGTAGALGLRAPDGALVDSVAYGTASDGLGEGTPASAPPTSQSDGRIPNGTDTNSNSADFAVRPTPTPGAAN